MYCRFGAVCSQQLVALGGRLRSEKSHFSHSDDRMGVVGQQDGDDPVARVAPLPAAATHINDCENRVSGLLIKDYWLRYENWHAFAAVFVRRDESPLRAALSRSAWRAVKDGQQSAQMRIGRLDLPGVGAEALVVHARSHHPSCRELEQFRGRLERRRVARNASHVGL